MYGVVTHTSVPGKPFSNIAALVASCRIRSCLSSFHILPLALPSRSFFRRSANQHKSHTRVPPYQNKMAAIHQSNEPDHSPAAAALDNLPHACPTTGRHRRQPDPDLSLDARALAGSWHMRQPCTPHLFHPISQQMANRHPQISA